MDEIKQKLEYWTELLVEDINDLQTNNKFKRALDNLFKKYPDLFRELNRNKVKIVFMNTLPNMTGRAVQKDKDYPYDIIYLYQGFIDSKIQERAIIIKHELFHLSQDLSNWTQERKDDCLSKINTLEYYDDPIEYEAEFEAQKWCIKRDLCFITDELAGKFARLQMGLEGEKVVSNIWIKRLEELRQNHIIKIMEWFYG